MTDTLPITQLHQAIALQLEIVRQMQLLDLQIRQVEDDINDIVADMQAPELPPSEWKEDYEIA